MAYSYTDTELEKIIITVKNFASGLLTFDWENLPTEVHFLVHIFLAFSLLAIFPISKLLHVPGNTTTHQTNQPNYHCKCCIFKGLNQ
jgi:nitrate reductase gamma subunit